MDGLQVQQENTNTFVGVYHKHMGGDRFCLNLATSQNAFGPYIKRTTVDCDYASQGELKRLNDGRYLLAYEKNNDNGRPYVLALLLINIIMQKIFLTIWVTASSMAGPPTPATEGT